MSQSKKNPILSHSEIFNRVRELEISTRKRVENELSGMYKSQFKGHGMQFSEFREYVPGDDVRHISWTVSARSKNTVVKRFEEERELNLMIAFDVSASESFKSDGLSKREVLAECCSFIVFAAMKNGDKIGSLIFTDQVESISPPKKSRSHALKIIRDLFYLEPKGIKTQLKSAFFSTDNLLKHRSIVIIASDFHCERDYMAELKRLSKKHEVIALIAVDEKERNFPRIGLIETKDPETGKTFIVDSNSQSFQNTWKTWQKKHEDRIKKSLSQIGVQTLFLSSNGNHLSEVISFFKIRKMGSSRSSL